ncbi:hypothetical protein PGT21_035264 [Puccinia graminis f. sp. tritici]|uniref:Secreted protein n=1 Tax=Puccinia graminis f. sp. tritici TaxID=56615 RepID=A0A5B0NTT6_PUCGR|nr:hypothetical protein PGTUg99_036571 [Puccinia graminis f. sp. tritici]KAA1091530.1 hypothetical protein PGT21_035264 [Puccinia graminis f. sp. tritici]
MHIKSLTAIGCLTGLALGSPMQPKEKSLECRTCCCYRAFSRSETPSNPHITRPPWPRCTDCRQPLPMPPPAQVEVDPVTLLPIKNPNSKCNHHKN